MTADTHAKVDRFTPGRPSVVHEDATYRVIEVGPPVIRARKLRAIHLKDSTKHDMEVVGFMLPFLILFVMDIIFVPVWAAIPGVAVIVACMLITAIVLGAHSSPSGPPTTKETPWKT